MKNNQQSNQETNTDTNTVSSFFYYMWNAWSQDEYAYVYGAGYHHFWSKWCGFCQNYCIYAATERMYAELSDDNRAKLVTRACELYDGRKRREVISSN